MQIGTISKTGSMRLLKDEHTCLTPFRTNNYFNRPLPGFALSLFAEKIIKKYEILGDYDIESVALVFLQTLLAEAEQNKELETRVEQTLSLLVLWNQRQDINNQLICHPNVYLTNLRNEIELNLSYIKQLNLSQYQQLYKLYSDAKAEQNLIVCQTLITELNASARTSLIRDNQIIKNAQTILQTSTIKPHSLSRSLRITLASVKNLSHTPGNREIFYSSVSNQIIHHLIENRMGDIKNVENVQLNNLEEIIDFYQSLWAGRVSASSIQNQAQLLEHIQNTAPGELAVAFPRIVELMKVDKYSAIQRSSMRLFFPEYSQAISNLVINRDADQRELAVAFPKIMELMNLDKYGAIHQSSMRLFFPEHSQAISDFVIERDANQRHFAVTYPKIMELMNISKYSTLQRLNMRLFLPEYGQATANSIIDRDADQDEVAALSSQVIKLMNVGKHSIFPRLNTQLLSPEHSRTISHLIIDKGRLSPQALSFLKQQSFTKSELFRIIDQGSRDEKVLIFEALNFAVEKIAPTRLNNTVVNSMSTLSSLLKNAESNEYDFSRYYELDGTGSTLKEYANRQELLVWNEIEKQVNQYKTTVSRQINNIGLLQSALTPSPKNDQVITVLGNMPNESIFNTIGAVIKHTSADNRGNVSLQQQAVVHNVERINQNLKGSVLRNIKNYWLRSEPALQYLIPQASASFADNKIFTGPSERQNSMVMNLISRLNNFIMSTITYGAPFSEGEKFGAMHGRSKILPSSLLNDSLIIRHQPSTQTTSVDEGTSREVKSSFYLQKTLPNRLEKSLYIMRNPVFNLVKKLSTSDMSSNVILKKVSNMIISPLKTQLLNKPYSSIYNTEISSLSRYLINNKAVNEMTQSGDLYPSKDGLDYHNTTINDRTDIENTAVMIIHTADQVPKQERQNEDLAMPSQSELINKFGNLISNPNLPPAELIGRQPGSLLSDDTPDVLAKDFSITELIKKISLGEHIIREEQNKVTQIHQKVKEQEEVINNLNQAYDQLQEEMASRINDRKIASMIMKELRAKLSLDKMRYGLQ